METQNTEKKTKEYKEFFDEKGKWILKTSGRGVEEYERQKKIKSISRLVTSYGFDGTSLKDLNIIEEIMLKPDIRGSD